MSVTNELSPKILLIENDPAAAEAIRAALTTTGNGTFYVEWVRRLSEGLERLNESKIDAVLLELSLPDSQGMETFDKLFAAAPDAPVLILGGNISESLAIEAVGRGAQDYLLPGHLNSYSLPRALRNAIERKAVEDALFIERERALVTLNSIGDAVLCTDIAGKISYLNLVAENMTGWRREEANGQPLAAVFRTIDGVSRKTAHNPLQMALAHNTPVERTVNCILIRRDGFEYPIEDSAAPIHDRAGRVTGVVIVFRDVSASRAISLQLTHFSQHDLVTNLPNRLLLNDRISQAISLARLKHRPLAVLFLDLDRFKYINDSLGPSVGDQLLRSVANRLVASVRGSDTISRQGGDEFVILLSEINHPESAANTAKKILDMLHAPHFINGQDLHIDASIGISIFPADGHNAETLIKNADTAMYHAKKRGGNKFHFFEAEMTRKAVERQMLESSLRHAIERNEFLLHYQPKVRLDTGEITGVEALIRWRHPDRGLVPPSEFVPIAEDCGLIIQIGRWALREACRQVREWQASGLPQLPIAVNVSAVQFHDPGFVDDVRTVLAQTGLQPRYLELEITEGILMTDGGAATTALRQLKQAGVHLAVDDFGTGYSSLSYLRRFPIDILKIDRSFVQQISADPDDCTIVSAIISLGKSLKHVVVAEGIETAEQRAYLQSQLCTEGQGYLFSRPLAADQFAQLLRVGIEETLVHQGVGGR